MHPGTKLPSIETNRKEKDKSKILEILDEPSPRNFHENHLEKEGKFIKTIIIVKINQNKYLGKSDEEINPLK